MQMDDINHDIFILFIKIAGIFLTVFSLFFYNYLNTMNLNSDLPL
jgi:hypothetical protein